MTYFETELVFISEGPDSGIATRNHGGSRDKGSPVSGQAEVLGINLRLGNHPLVYSLEDLSRRSGKPRVSILPSGQDYYLVVHAISAVRTQGSAKVDELQYVATAIQPTRLQTVDLVPKTRFNQLVNAGFSLEGAIGLFGEVSYNVSSDMMDALLNDFIDLGPGMQLQLSASAGFIGRFVYTLKMPVVQASGISSDSCSWILRPDENKTPLLGDQLLVQTIAVPKGTKTISYNISGMVKADKGLFWKQQQKSTPEYLVEIDLDPNNTRQL